LPFGAEISLGEELHIIVVLHCLLKIALFVNYSLFPLLILFLILLNNRSFSAILGWDLYKDIIPLNKHAFFGMKVKSVSEGLLALVEVDFSVNKFSIKLNHLFGQCHSTEEKSQGE
jgi:hypothetical protein